MLTVEEMIPALPGPFLRVDLPRPDLEVTWVASTELFDPGEFLEGGELVLTTGLFGHGWTQTDWTQYVRRLRRAGVSALGLGTGVAFDDAPAPLAEACAREGMNLLVFAEEVTFVSISRQVAQLLTAPGEPSSPTDQTGLMIQQEFSRAAAKGSETAILRTLAGVFRGTAALLDQTGRLRHRPIGSEADSFPADQIALELARLQRRGAVTVAEGGRYLSLQPLGLGRNTEGYLAITYSDSPTLWQRSALSLAVSLLGVSAEAKHQRLLSESQARAILVRLLLAGDTDGAEVAADEVGVELPAELQVAQIWVGGGGHLVELERRLEPHLLTSVFLGWKPERDRVTLVADPQFFATLPPGFWGHCRVGFGPAGPPAQVAEGDRRAGLALRGTDPTHPVLSWEQVADNSLSHLLAEDTALAFAERQLGPILGDPRQLETLRAYLQAGGGAGEMARRLGIHRNSVGQRLARLQTLLARDLTDPGVRAHLWVALEILAEDRAGAN